MDITTEMKDTLSKQLQTPQESSKQAQSYFGKWRVSIEPWRKATLAILPTFLYTRILFVVLTYLGVVLFTVPNYSLQTLSTHTLLYSWNHWDAARLAEIASQGYTSLEYAAFFPLFPLLERAVALFLGGDPILAGMLISNLAFLAMLVVLYRFVEMECDSATAKRAAFYISIFPTALFFFAAYNESLFMLFMLLAFYALRRGSWWLAGLFGGLATLTRSIGLILAVIFLYEFVRQVLPPIRQAWHEKQRWYVFKLLSGLLPAGLIPLGLGIYAYSLNQVFHDPLAFSHAQAYWHIGPTFPWQGIVTALKVVATGSPYTFATPHVLIDLSAVCLFSLLLLLCFVGPERFARNQWPLLLFAIGALLFPLLFPSNPGPLGLLYDPLPSMQRYVLEIFPAFILLARLGRRPWFHQGYILCALPLLTFFVLQFVTGHWTI